MLYQLMIPTFETEYYAFKNFHLYLFVYLHTYLFTNFPIYLFEKLNYFLKTFRNKIFNYL